AREQKKAAAEGGGRAPSVLRRGRGERIARGSVGRGAGANKGGPCGGGSAVPAEGREACREVGCAPRQDEPVDAAEEPQWHRVLIGGFEVVGQESTDWSAGGDVVGHALEERGVER